MYGGGYSSYGSSYGSYGGLGGMGSYGGLGGMNRSYGMLYVIQAAEPTQRTIIRDKRERNRILKKIQVFI